MCVAPISTQEGRMRIGKDPRKVGYQLSKHAEIRAQQRGIRQQIIGLVTDHADQRLHAGNGLVSLRLSRRCLRDLGAAGINTSLLEKAKGVVVLMCPRTNTVVTTMHDLGHSGRRHRNQYESWSNRGGSRRAA